MLLAYGEDGYVEWEEWSNSYYKTNTGITEVPTDIPDRARDVYLTDNRIVTITTGAFSNLSLCTGLYLDHNEISEIRRGMFDGLVSLVKLSLTWNRIRQVEPGSFRSLTRCVTIMLIGNQLTEVNPGTWEGLESVEFLYLNYNRIKRLQTGAFVNPGNQTEELRSLKRLLLMHNDLETIESRAFYGLENCEELSLTIENSTQIKPGAWGGLMSLQWFSAGGIRNITVDMFRGLTHAHAISLSYNDIVTIETGAFADMTRCEYLDLAANNLRDLRAGMWRGLVALEILHLESNLLPEVRDDMWWNGSRNLLTLYLMRNKIEVIHTGAFRHLGNLRTLYLTGNYITEIRGDMWQGLTSLTNLNVDHSNITSVRTSGFANLPKINEISLKENNLTTVPADLFGADEFPDTGGHPASLQLDLEGNPLRCDDDDICWLQEAQEGGWLTSTIEYTCDNHDDDTPNICLIL